jgi:uncharacterized coiled-coil DUF342 family protein
LLAQRHPIHKGDDMGLEELANVSEIVTPQVLPGSTEIDKLKKQLSSAQQAIKKLEEEKLVLHGNMQKLKESPSTSLDAVNTITRHNAKLTKKISTMQAEMDKQKEKMTKSSDMIQQPTSTQVDQNRQGW